MYCLTEQQITFILDDIKKNGVEMEDLQLNLLDHICCIIENELEANGDFEQFYFATIKTFYNKRLSEIEVETISLVNNKNYYVMKKVMMISGIVSAGMFSIGITFKFMHWPGAAVLMVLGIGILNLVFLPLLLTIKVKEKQNIKDKVLISLGMLAAISMVLSILFRVMHWPGSLNMGYFSVILLLLVYMPIHLIFGLKNEDTKVNTIVTTVLLITGCCLWLTMVISPKSLRKQELRNSQRVIRNMELLQHEQQQVQELAKKNILSSPLFQQGEKINALCNALASALLLHTTGHETTDPALKNNEVGIADSYFNDYLEHSAQADSKLNELRLLTAKYNESQFRKTGNKLLSIPVTDNILDKSNDKASDKIMQAFNDIFQIQMYVLQNERVLLAEKSMTADL